MGSERKKSKKSRFGSPYMTFQHKLIKSTRKKMCESSRDGPDGQKCHIWPKTGNFDFSKFFEILENLALCCGLSNPFWSAAWGRGREICTKNYGERLKKLWRGSTLRAAASKLAAAAAARFCSIVATGWTKRGRGRSLFSYFQKAPRVTLHSFLHF